MYGNHFYRKGYQYILFSNPTECLGEQIEIFITKFKPDNIDVLQMDSMVRFDVPDQEVW